MLVLRSAISARMLMCRATHGIRVPTPYLVATYFVKGMCDPNLIRLFANAGGI